MYGVLLGVCLADGAFNVWRHSSWHKESLYHLMISSPGRESFAAAEALAELSAERELTRGLRERSPRARRLAIGALWDVWYHAAGEDAFERAQMTVTAMQTHDYPRALRMADLMTAKYPRFAEGWNRRATILWQMGRYEESLADCRKVVALNPDHFGAWQGMGLCQIHLAEIRRAANSFRIAARLQPYDRPTRVLLEECLEYNRSHRGPGAKPSDREI
jgi:tetratricopeptide (TPR) repeat protein